MVVNESMVSGAGAREFFGSTIDTKNTENILGDLKDPTEVKVVDMGP